MPFFSRRLGLSDDGTPIPIVGGARLSGRAGDYDVGVMTMKTEDFVPRGSCAEELAQYLDRRSDRHVARWNGQRQLQSGVRRRHAPRFFGQKLDVASYLLASKTPDLIGHDLAKLLGAAWRANELTWAGQYEQVQTHFNPEVGSWLRYYIVEGGADYYADGNGDLETRLQSAGAGFMRQSGAQLVVRVQNTFDRLVEPFALRSSVVLLPGDYEYVRYSVTANSDPSQRVTAFYGFNTNTFLNAFVQYNAATH